MADHEKITFRTSIKPELMRLALKRGGPFAAAGALLIILGGTLLPLAALKLLGIPLFLSALLLIAIGILPYRKLQRLEVKPNVLDYDGEYFLFSNRGKGVIKIPEKSLLKAAYIEKHSLYGMAIWLKKPVLEKVKVLQKGFDIEAFTHDSQTRFEGCDLFLPYFTKRTVQEILDEVMSGNTTDLNDRFEAHVSTP